MYHEKDYRHRSIGAGILRLLGVYFVALMVLFAPLRLSAPEPQPRSDDLYCLASAVYYEARGEPLKGQRAVVDVIEHRAAKSGKSFCEVLRLPQQFQWTKRKPMRYDGDTLALLHKALEHPKVLNNETFLYFHATHVKPVWAKKMACEKIGKHKFCKEPKWQKT